MENFRGQITAQSNNMNLDLMTQLPAMVSTQMHGPVVTESSEQDRDPVSKW
jgi:hypothetical protein